MNIAFYPPLKPPDHPVPSGDRQMARLLIKTLAAAGHGVDIASSLRSFLPDPTMSAVSELQAAAQAEVDRISQVWTRSAAPDCWLTYHPYYKAPDLIGPALAEKFSIPYATIEASYSRRRNVDGWSITQARVAEAVKMASVNFCFTRRDRDGLAAMEPAASLTSLPPFIDTTPYVGKASPDNPGRLMTIAMMRKGDKFDSYRMLAEALQMIPDLPWRLSIIGDGSLRQAVGDLFAAMPGGRIEWLGEVQPNHIPALIVGGGIYVWPGFGEAYGLAYLEAEAAGLPVIAQDIAGVPEVVSNGVTGLLTPAGDTAAFATAIRTLLTDEERRKSMAAAAHRFVCNERSMQQAGLILNSELERSMHRKQHGR